MLVPAFRCVDSVAVVATFCATVLLVKSCVCVSEEDDEVLDKKQLAEYYSKLGWKGLLLVSSVNLADVCVAARITEKPQRAHATVPS